jgi:glycosyltransferase involved in cell wall biosynthesis
MLNIAIVIADTNNSSIKTISTSIRNGLKNKCKIRIYAVKQSIYDHQIQRLTFNIHQLGKYDIIQLHSALPITFSPLFRIIYPKAIIISTEQDFGWKYFKNTLPLHKSILLRILLHFGRLLCHYNTYPSLALMKNVLSKKKQLRMRYRVVYNGIDDIDIYKKNVMPQKIVVVGNYYYSKGFDIIIDNLNSLSSYEIHVFGKVGEDKTMQSVSSIQKNIILHGKVPRDEYLGFIKTNDCIICIPSRTEAFCLVLIEGMSAKCPVVVSNIDVFRELTSPKTAVMFNLEDRYSLASAIKKAQQNHKRITDNAHAIYKKKYTTEAMVKNYHILYNNILTD